MKINKIITNFIIHTTMNKDNDKIATEKFAFNPFLPIDLRWEWDCLAKISISI